MFTYPSEYVTLPNGLTSMIVYELGSTTGLTKWVDYIPVQWNASTTSFNTFDYTGSLIASVITSTTGKVAGTDYINIYVVASGIPWIDYIPLVTYSAGSGKLLLESSDRLLLEDGSLILLEGS